MLAYCRLVVSRRSPRTDLTQHCSRRMTTRLFLRLVMSVIKKQLLFIDITSHHLQHIICRLISHSYVRGKESSHLYSLNCRFGANCRPMTIVSRSCTVSERLNGPLERIIDSFDDS